MQIFMIINIFILAILMEICQQQKLIWLTAIYWQTRRKLKYKFMKPNPSIICCPPLLEGRLTPDNANYLATTFRVLGEPARLQILSLIAAQPSQEVCACELVETLGLAQYPC